jgi:hypothetical protein
MTLIMMNELVTDVTVLIVANKSYEISMQAQTKTTRKPTQDSRLYDRDFNRNQPNLNQERFL